MKKYSFLIIITLVIIATFLSIPFCINKSFKAVKAVKIKQSAIVTTVECSGSTEAATCSDILLPYQVKIKRNLYNIGDRVKKGDKLIEIDKTVTEQFLEASGDSSVVNSENVSATSSIDTKNTLDEALNAGLITKETYDALSEKLTEKDSQTASASKLLNADENNVQKVINDMESDLKAPISGVITNIADGTDGITPAGTVVASISDPDSIQVKAMVDEENVKNVKIGQTAKITGTGFDGEYYGIVKKIFPSVDKTTTGSGTKKTVGVIISINHQGTQSTNLIPGLTVDVTIKTSEKYNILKVPYSAVKQDDFGNEYVYIFKEGIAVKKNVKTGSEDDYGVEIVSGIKNGSIVIEDTSDTIADGDRVRIS